MYSNKKPKRRNSNQNYKEFSFNSNLRSTELCNASEETRSKTNIDIDRI